MAPDALWEREETPAYRKEICSLLLEGLDAGGAGREIAQRGGGGPQAAEQPEVVLQQSYRVEANLLRQDRLLHHFLEKVVQVPAVSGK